MPEFRLVGLDVLTLPMLRRIAESVECFHAGNPVHILFNTAFPYDVDEVIEVGVHTPANLEDAIERVRKSGGAFALAGPFRNPVSVGASAPAAVRGPVFIPPRRTIVALEHQVAEVVVRFGTGPWGTKTFRVNPTGTGFAPVDPTSIDGIAELDTLLLTPTAVKTFLEPYLTRVYGLQRAASAGSWIQTLGGQPTQG